MGTCRCCHGSRDLRCGVIGDKLIQRLQTLIQEREWQENVKVFRCSHVGGHKVMTADFAGPQAALLAVASTAS